MKTQPLSESEFEARLMLFAEMSKRLTEIGIQVDPYRVMSEILSSRERDLTYIMIVVRDSLGGSRRSYELRDNSIPITIPPHPAHIGI